MGLSPTRIAQFRLSLLVSLGIVPVACGGTTRGEPQGGVGGSGGSPSSAGTTSKAGTSNVAGTPSSEGSTNSAGTAGAASMGSAGSTTSAGSTSTGGGPGQIVPCTSPVSDPVTGFVTCAEGFVHRPTAVVCGAGSGGADDASGGASALEPLPRTDGSVPCVDDPDPCGAFQYGYCNVIEGAPELSTCHSGCAVDQDCGPSARCVCGDAQSPTSGVCRPSQCLTDADCQPGYLCATYTSSCGAIFDRVPRDRDFSCQTPQDECVVDEDCANGSGDYLCTSTGEGRVCGQTNPACGRPFLVDAQPRLAPAVVGGA